MTLADAEKPNDGNQWEDEEYVVTALVGEDIFIELKLKPEEAQNHQCFLLFRGDQLISPDRYNVQTRDNIIQLTLKHSQKDDTGHYSLVTKKLLKYPFAKNGTHEGLRKRIRMNIQEASNDPVEGEPPIFVRRLTDLAVKVGTRTRFLVEIRSSSNPKVIWHRNDHPVQEGSRFTFAHERNFYCVDVAPVMIEDQGHWTCMVENIHGRSSCTSCLSVFVPKAYKPPEFVEELRALLSETGIVCLECKVIGVPIPVLRWFKDDREIKAGNVFAMTANADDPTSLGIYTCQASNCLGTAFSSSKVHVVGRGSREGSLKPADPLKSSGPPPIFEKLLNDESCKIGDTITLFTQVQVPPWPKIISWYNKEGKVEPNDKYHIIEDGLGTYSIEIRGVEAMDEGEWKCVATSDENVMQFTTCNVSMSIPRNYRIPRFMESLKAVLTDEGLVSFECKVVGFPIPLLRWFKDGQELKPGDVYQLTGTNSLGSYCCIARNCMGEARSTAELTIEDIQNQLNEEERLQLSSYNQVPKFLKGLGSCEAKIEENFAFTIQVSIAVPEPTLSWYRDDEPIEENDKYKITRKVLGNCTLEIQKLEFIDQAEWKCIAENDFGHSITSCFLKLIIPKHFKKPKFLESLRAILNEEGTVNLECKVIGVPQPVLTWYKDGVELKPGDIYRITSGQDGTCCLGIYTCKATNCMGAVSSSASLLGFEDKMDMKKEGSKTPNSPIFHDLARNLSLSTIHEERTSQLYDTPQTDYSVTMDDKGEISFSFDGKEVSVSLYETPDLTEEEAIQIVEMYADQFSEHITEGNIIELPPMRFTKETSTTGNLVMEAVVIDVSPEYFVPDEEADDLRTEADFDDVSIMDDQMQSILSSYSSPIGEEHSVDRTPVSSPIPKPRAKQKRSESDSSSSEKYDKRDKEQQKIMDWSESYHSAKEPSFHAQLSVQSQDSVDAFADALSSEGLIKTSPKSLEKEILKSLNAKEDVEEFENRLDKIISTSFQAEELGKNLTPERRKRKIPSQDEITLSEISSEESYTMNLNDDESKEKINTRASEQGKKGIKENNFRTKNDENKRLSQAVQLMPESKSRDQQQYIQENYEIRDEKLSSIEPIVSSSAAETSEKLNQKEKLLDSLKALSNPVFVLRESIINLDTLMEFETKVDKQMLHELIINKIVHPIENICEKMSEIENDAIKFAGTRSLIQEVKILLLDSIGGPTEELLRGIESIKSHKNGTQEELKSDLIILESLTDPVDEISASLTKIEYGLRHKEGSELIIRAKNPIIFEKMKIIIDQFGNNLNNLLKNPKVNKSEEFMCLCERLQFVYQTLDSFLTSLPLNKITAAIENNTDVLLIKTLMKPLKNLDYSLNEISQSQEDIIELKVVNELENLVSGFQKKLDTLTTTLMNYEKKDEKHKAIEKNLELVSHLKWTMDDVSDKLEKMKQLRENQVSTTIENIFESILITTTDKEKELEAKQHDQILELTKHDDYSDNYLADDAKDKTNTSEAQKLELLGKKIIKYASEKELSFEVSQIETSIDPEKPKSRRATYVSRIASLDSAYPELDESLPLVEMLLDPLIDVQAKLNVPLRHYKCQIQPDQASLPATELSSALTELCDCISSAVHIATTLSIEDTLNCIIDFKESLLDIQIALTSSLSPEEYFLVKEIIKPLNELNKILLAVTRSSSCSEPSKIILNEMAGKMSHILNQIMSVEETTISLEKSIGEISQQLVTVKPLEKLEQMSLTFTNIHFAMSSVLEKANKSSYNVTEIIKSEDEHSLSSPAHKLISSINTLRQSIGKLPVAFTSPVSFENGKLENNDNIIFEELSKLQKPLLNLQNILLIEKHDPEERHILNDILTPLRALKECISEMTKGQSIEIVQLIENIEKNISLVAMEASKEALVEKVNTEESITIMTDSAPREVLKVLARWLNPIENWLTSQSAETNEKEEDSSVIAQSVDNFKTKLLQIAIMSSYSKPPSDAALIEELAKLNESLLKVYKVITSQYSSKDIEIMKNLIRPTRHLLGTILDVSLINQAGSVLRPILETAEQLENQIPLSIKMASYMKDLQKAEENLVSKEESGEEKSDSEDIHLFDDFNDTKIAFTVEDKKEIKKDQRMMQLETEKVSQSHNIAEQAQALIVEQQDVCEKDSKILKSVQTDSDFSQQQKIEIETSTVRVEKLDLWTLTILDPLDRLASSILSLDRSLDEEIHSLLCQPLDSLHKQIELVESQINRPAGQLLENDVETIIEGFLSPMKQVETGLKSAAEIWQENLVKNIVLKILQDLLVSSSNLYQQLDYLKNKLITEAPEQTIQIQKTEATLIKTINAVLVPLNGIRNTINKILEETILDDKQDDNTEESTLVAEHIPNNEIKEIEQATARPLQKLIEAIVDPENVRTTSTSPEIMQSEEVVGLSQKETAENLQEKMAKIISDGDETIMTFESPVNIFGELQKIVTAESQENLAMVENKPEMLLTETFQEFEEFVREEQSTDIKNQCEEQFKEQIKEQFIQQERENNLSQLTDYRNIDNLSMATTAIVKTELKEIYDSTPLETHDENISALKRKTVGFTHSVDEILGTVTENITQDVIVDSPSDNVKNIVTEKLLNADKKLALNLQSSMEFDSKNFLDHIEKIVTSELDRQNALSFKHENFIKDVGTAVREKMIKSFEICQEHIFEESVRDIIVEELLKVKSLLQTDVCTENIVTPKTQTIEQILNIDLDTISDENINEIILYEIHKQKIQFLNQENLIQSVKIKIHHFLSSSQNLEKSVLEENIRKIIIEEIQKNQQKEKKIHNVIVDELEKQKESFPKTNENLIDIVKSKVYETITLFPEFEQEYLLENEVQNIMIRELNSLKTAQMEQTSDNELSQLVIESKMLPQKLEESVKDMTSEEIEKKIIHPANEEVVMLEPKIIEKFNSCIKVMKEDISEGALEQIVKEVQKYSTERMDSKVQNELEQVKFLEDLEDTGTKAALEKDTIDKEQISGFTLIDGEKQVDLSNEDKTKNVNIAKNDKVSTPVEVFEEQAAEIENEDSSHILILQEIPQQVTLKLKVHDKDQLIESKEIVVTDISDYKHQLEERTREAKQGEILADETQSIMISKTDLQDARIIDNEESVTSSTIKVQDDSDNDQKSFLDENLVNITKIEAQKKEGKIAEAKKVNLTENTMNTAKELENKSMVIVETVHDMIIEELERHHIQPSEHENIMNIVEQRIESFIIMHPKEHTTNKLEENIQKIVTQTLEEQKVNVSATEDFLKIEGKKVNITRQKVEQEEIQASKQIKCERISEDINEGAQLPKEEKTNIEDKNKIQEITVQYPEKLATEVVDEKVEDITAITTTEQKVKISEIEMLDKVDEQKSVMMPKADITSECKPKQKKEDKIELEKSLGENKQKSEILTQKTEIIEEKEEEMSKKILKYASETGKISPPVSQETNVIPISELKLDDIHEENNKLEPKSEIVIPEKEHEERHEENEKKEKIERLLRRPSEMLSQVPEDVIHDIMIEEINKLKIQPSEENNFMKAVECKVQDIITLYPKTSEEKIHEENVRQIIVEQLEEMKASIVESSKPLLQAKKHKNNLEVMGSSVTSQIQIPAEVVHDLVIEEFHKQNIELSEKNDLVKAIETKIYDLIAQHTEISRENMFEENVKEIITEELDEQNARVLEIEKLEEANQQKKIVEVFNISEMTQEQISEAFVHEMIIEELHKKNIEPLMEDYLVKAVEAKAYDLIAQHPEICKSDILEENIKEIISEEWTVQQVNITETQNQANKQTVQVEVQKIEPKTLKKIETVTEDFPTKVNEQKSETVLQYDQKKSEQEPLALQKDKSEPKLSEIDKTELKVKVDKLKQKPSENDKSSLELTTSQEKTEENQIKILQSDDKLNKIKSYKIEEAQDTHDDKIQNSVVEKQEIKRDNEITKHIKKTEKNKIEYDDKKDNGKETFSQSNYEENSSKSISIIKKDEFESDFSKSAIKDYLLKDNENQSVPPTIEIDYDDTLSYDLSLRRSNVSTLSRRHQNLESVEYDDKSISHYSSITSRLPSYTPGPRNRGKKPTFCTKLTDRTAAEDSRIKLTCTILSDSELEVHWLKNGKILPPSSNKHGISLENGMASLEFHGIKSKDAGEYSCIAKNPYGEARTEAKLKVYSGYELTASIPTFTRSIKDTYNKEENALILECRVRAQPSPTITWLKDGQVLETGDRYQQSDLVDGICRLKIFYPNDNDHGLYTCRAENETRLSDRTSHLVDFKAQGRSKRTSWHSNKSSYCDATGTDKDFGRPRFSSYLVDHSVPAGGTIALQVEVEGAPSPEVTWIKTDNKGTISVPRAKTFADSGIYTLIVPNATELETGTYICRASNTYGHVDTSANVEVITGGKDGNKPAIFISRPPDKVIIVAVGEDVSVSFRAGGIPKPKVIWMKGLRDITNGPRSYKEGHDDYVRLTLKRACPLDEGTYCILLKNRYGCDRSFFSIQVKQKARSLTPSLDWDTEDTDNLLATIHDKERSYMKQVPAPISSDPIVTDGGRNWLALTWGKPERKGPAPVIAYKVDAWLLGGDGGARWVELGVTPVNAFDAFNLRPGEEYKFRITPRNRYGWGEPVIMKNSVTVREVVKFPEFTKILSGQLKALQGTILSLECEVSSDTTGQIKWYRDSTEILNGQDSKFTTYFNGTKCSLMIGNIIQSDSGRYICEATNTAGRASTFVKVQVVDDPKIVEADLKLCKMRSSDTMSEERPPEFTMRLRDRRVQVTYPVRLTCQVTGYPEPKVTWFKYREELQSHDNILIWNDEAHFHTLEISRSTIDDSGVYIAQAKNAYGSVSCHCHLVVDKGIRAYIAPEFLGHLDAVYTVKAGGELRMTARVEAYPTVGVTWHRDGHRLRPSRDVVMTLNCDGTVELDLAHITPRDGGLYCCTATNEVGQAEITTRVVVLENEDTKTISQPLSDESSDIPYSKEPVFIAKPRSTEAYEGDTVIILCEVIGDPKPEVMWLRDFLRHDYYKDASHFRRIGAGPQYCLEIPYAKLDFTGTYSIIAKNCHGQTKAVISLQIYARGQGKEYSQMGSTIKHGNVQTLPVIRRPLKDLRCCDGDTISLECKVHAIPEPDVRWEKGGKLISLGGDFTTDFDGDTARLSIQHVYPEDEGEYTCVAYNDLGKAYTSACLIVNVPEGKETAISRRLIKPPGHLSPNSTPISTPRSTPVRSLSPSCISRREVTSTPKTSRECMGKRPKIPTNPKFYAVPHNRIVEEGDTVRFQCAIAGHPVPWVIWDKDGISITPTARVSLKESDDVRYLEITDVNCEDAGLYRVTLENDMGRTEASARLEIIRGRRNSASKSIGTKSASPRIYSIYGSRGNISPSSRCDNSLRPPHFIGLREKGAISPTLFQYHRNEKHSTQTNTKSNKTTNASENNKINRIVRSSSIPKSNQQIKDREKPEPKKILSSPKEFKKNKNQPCQKIESSISKQFPSVLKLNKMSTRGLKEKSSLKSSNKNFKINQKQQEDINTEKPKAPAILTVPADVIALRGSKVMLLSNFSKFPKPTVRWLKKGQDIVMNNKTIINTSSGLTCLTLKDITTNESGKYEILVENQFGKSSRFVNITVEGPPEPPRDLGIIKNNSKLGEVILSWRSPIYDGGSAITGYSIEMRKGNESSWVAIAEAKYSLSHKIQRLDPDEPYRFRVRAENIHGLSEPGMESEIIHISSKDINQMNKIIEPLQSSEKDFEEVEPTSEVIPESGHLFEERFDVLEELGKGRYGVVRRILDKKTGLIYAAKFVRTIKTKDKQQVRDEINIMNTLKHPKLLRLLAAFDSPKEMIMVTEYISGGELFERVVADDFTLTEKDCILFLRQICQAVEYLHYNKVVHLDLKPENIMCYARTSHQIKLIDFGLAQTLKPDTPVRVLFGTPEFIPPEIISFEPIGTESDMWSVGVICYVLLTGLSPFMGENDAETFANITRADFDFDDKAFHAISQEAKDFISSLLIKKKELRMSATECLKHPWLAQCAESMSRVALPKDKLKKFIVRRKWQKTGNAIRALGRMAILSANSRKNIASSPSTPDKLEPDSENNPILSFNEDSQSQKLNQILIKHESMQNLCKIDKNQESVEEPPPFTGFPLDECLENADSLTVIEPLNSEGDADSKIVLMMNKVSSPLNKHINDLHTDFITELKISSDEISKTDTSVSCFTDFKIKNVFTTDIDVKYLSEMIQVQKVDTERAERFCNVASLQINESEQDNDKCLNELTENDPVIDKNNGAKIVDVLKKEEITEKTIPLIQSNFITFKNNTHLHESVSKPWCQTNSSSLGNEDEISRIKKSSLSHRVVRTGSVSQTAKMFEREEIPSSISIKQPTNPGSRKTFLDSSTRPQNERIRKAFAFWNK